MLAWQDTALDSAMIYDARLGSSSYGAMFNCLTNEPYPEYYSFTAFNRLYSLKNQVEVLLDEAGVYSVGARNGKEGWLVVSNTTEKDLSLDLDMKQKIETCFITADGKNDCEIEFDNRIPAFGLLSIKFRLD